MVRAWREPISKPGIPHEDDTADGRNAQIAVRLGSVFCCASTRQCEHCRWRSRIDCREIFRALGAPGAVTLLLFRRHLWHHLGLRRVAHEEPGQDLRPDAHSHELGRRERYSLYRLDTLLPEAVQSRILGSGPNLVGRMSE